MRRKRLAELAEPLRALRRFFRSVRPATRSRPVRLERLEPRRLMAITVTSLGDEFDGIGNGSISLREAVFHADGGETIDFAVHGTIQLGSEISIDKNLTINGPGAGLLTINANRGVEEIAGDGQRIFLIDGGSFSTDSVRISGLRLAGGDVAGEGGAILNREDLTIEDCVLTDNVSFNAGGGAIYNADGELTIVSSVISGNRTSAGNGAAIFNESGDVSVQHTFIRANSAEGTGARGGGIHSLDGSVSISYSTIAFNSAVYGGGISLDGGSLSATNCTISGNRSQIDGGGVHLKIRPGEQVDFRHATITANRSDIDNDGWGDGGGMFVDSSSVAAPDLNHTILAGNFKGTSDSQPADISGSWSGDFNIVNDVAKLGPLLFNGGDVPTHALLPDSPAIDAGDPDAIAGAGLIPYDDARGEGFTRVFDGGGEAGPQIDIGAFELQSTGVPLFLIVDTLVDELDGNYAAGDLSLREAILLTNENHGTPDTITFDAALAGGTIHLTMGELAITDSLTLTGLGSALLTIDASLNDLTPFIQDGTGSRIFNVDDGNRDVKSDVTITGLRLVGGDSYSGGGAIRNSENLTVRESEVSGNSAKANGGGILSLNGNLNVIDSIISGNTTHKDYATYGGGGGIATFSYLKLASAAVFGNVSAGHGGGIFAADGKLTIVNSTISGNSSGAGGSTTHQEGGGIFIGKDMDSGYSDVKIAHSTITRNSSPATGAGIYVSTMFAPSFGVNHSIVAGNFGPDTNGYGLSFVFSLTNVDPLLAPLGYNGGWTPTHAPLAGSPAIDGGDPNAVAGTGEIPLFDQRGSYYARASSKAGPPRIDIGAHETQPPAAPGDSNGDNVVNAADYTVWRNSFGHNVGVYTSGDTNGDGVVTPTDYAIWKTNFGTALGGGGGSVARSGSAAADGAASAAAPASISNERITDDSSIIAASEPITADIGTFTTVVAPIDTRTAPDWTALRETRVREFDGRDVRGRRWRAELVSPRVRDLLLESICSDDRRADRKWEADNPYGFAGNGRVASEAVDSAIDSIVLDTGSGGLLGRKYKLRL